MRSLFLASAAVIVSAGLACAQTMAPSPAPTGAPNAPAVTAPGNSPGNTAPAPTGGGMGMSNGQTTATPLNSSGSSGTSTTPPTNSTSMPNMSPSAPMSPSNTMAPPPFGSSSSMMAPKKKMMSSHMASHNSMGMPSNGTPMSYLHMAQTAISHGNKASADEALSMAESRLLNRAVPAGSNMSAESPAVTSIISARKAVASGDMHMAAQNTSMAMQQAGGTGGTGGGMGMKKGMSSGMSNQSSMSK